MKLKTQNLKLKANKEKVLAMAVFVVLGFIALQIPINNLAGSGAKFTLFDLFAPTAGAFLGSWIGVLAVLLMQIANLLFHGFANLDRGSIIRLFPVLFGVWFFARSTRPGQTKLLIIPILAIVSFNLNEVGRSAWQFSMFWLIPILVYPAVKRSLVARALASTFVAHSVGGAFWIWTFNLPTSVWQGLIPVVAFERGIMALGICASYILLNNLISILSIKAKVLRVVKTDKRYIKAL